jgi:hypothetical protein
MYWISILRTLKGQLNLKGRQKNSCPKRKKNFLPDFVLDLVSLIGGVVKRNSCPKRKKNFLSDIL